MARAISRRTHVYMVKGQFAETPDCPWPERSESEIVEYAAARKAGHEAHILRLPQPILCKRNALTDICQIKRDGKTARLYPPFELNDFAENVGSFEGVCIPEGEHKLAGAKDIPDSIPRALSSQPTYSDKDVILCQGLRVDLESGFPKHRMLEALLEQIGQYTHQWWLRAAHSPFNGMMRFGAEIDTVHRVRDEFRYAGAGKIDSTWYVARETQGLLGMEVPLSNGKWLLACYNVANEQSACSGVIAFHDALAAFVARDDLRCVLNLCLCIEILGNKRRLLQDKNPTTADSMLRTTDLVKDPEKRVLKNLIIDRGHIAHGKALHLLGSEDGVTIEDYVEATRRLFSGYLDKLEPGQWPIASQLELRRRKKKP